MQFEEIKKQYEELKSEGKRICMTSSFQTQSLPLLHMMSLIDSSLPVLFIQTGYHFAETLKFRDQLTKQLNLNLVETRPVTSMSLQVAGGKPLYIEAPDYCCHINKVKPLANLTREYDVWISGVRADQTKVRKSFQVLQPGVDAIMRFHPMLDWTKQDIEKYIREHKLPRHPLEKKGFFSVGCEPCTARVLDSDYSDPRYSRWLGLNKTECGIHTELVKK